MAYSFATLLQANSVLHWSELGIVKQISVVAGLALMFLVGLIASVILTNVWVRRGYEGIDKVLEGKEVALMMSHVFAFVSLEIFIFMITFRTELNPPAYAFWICSGTFLAPEIYMALNSLLKKKDKEV